MSLPRRRRSKHAALKLLKPRFESKRQHRAQAPRTSAFLRGIMQVRSWAWEYFDKGGAYKTNGSYKESRCLACVEDLKNTYRLSDQAAREQQLAFTLRDEAALATAGELIIFCP